MVSTNDTNEGNVVGGKELQNSKEVEKLDQAPDFYLDEDDSEADEESQNENIEVAKIPVKTVSLFKGEELKVAEITEVTYRFPVFKIYILGEHDSGKTTILATLFEIFQAAPFYDYHYAGSLTQIGFERRCFYSRLASGNDDFDTERTKAEEFRFLHLALKKSYLEKKATHLLLSDIAGEKIRRAKGNSEDMKDLSIISDSHHISFIIDGEKLIEIKTRQAALTQAKTFIRKAIDEKIIGEKTRLAIIVSKWDLVEGVEGFDYNQLLVTPFTRDFAARLNELDFLKIAARPENFKVFKLGHGLFDLLNLWFKFEKKMDDPSPEEMSSRMINNLIF